ncbi:MAG: hypothetical protein ACYDAG_14740, partial [Chloroflexota bacterium]
MDVTDRGLQLATVIVEQTPAKAVQATGRLARHLERSAQMAREIVAQAEESLAQSGRLTAQAHTLARQHDDALLKAAEVFNAAAMRDTLEATANLARTFEQATKPFQLYERLAKDQDLGFKKARDVFTAVGNVADTIGKLPELAMPKFPPMRSVLPDLTAATNNVARLVFAEEASRMRVVLNDIAVSESLAIKQALEAVHESQQ